MDGIGNTRSKRDGWELSITTKDTGMPGEKWANQEAPYWEIFVIFNEKQFEGNMS